MAPRGEPVDSDDGSSVPLDGGVVLGESGAKTSERQNGNTKMQVGRFEEMAAGREKWGHFLVCPSRKPRNHSERAKKKKKVPKIKENDGK